MKTVSVNLEPLEGKYYTSKITVTVLGNDGEQYKVGLEAFGGNWVPSQRELDNGWEPDHGMDHVESEATFFVMKKIMEALQ